METNSNNDQELWQIAKRRAGFKRNVLSYIIVVAMLWVIWWFTQGSEIGFGHLASVWPLWVMLGWGVGLAFQFFNAYDASKKDLIEREYEKLKRG
jgi:2TM domain